MQTLDPSLSYSDFEFKLSPKQPLAWPRSQRESILRGAFGSILREIACDPLCTLPSKCRFASQCAYQQVFAPRTPPNSTRLSLNSDLPRPFVLFADNQAEDLVNPGESASFTIRLFGRMVRYHVYLHVVFSQLLHRGFGPDRVPCAVTVEGKPSASAVSLVLGENGSVDPELSQVTVEFLTPTYLKDGGREVCIGSKAFAPLIRRARDRVSSLYHFYAAEEDSEIVALAWDFAGLGRTAERVICSNDNCEWVSRTRRSSRTGKVHD